MTPVFINGSSGTIFHATCSGDRGRADGYLLPPSNDREESSRCYSGARVLIAG